MSPHNLPTRIPSYLRRLASQYARTNLPLHKLVAGSRVLVIEDTGYDNWNGGQHGHDVRLYAPSEILGEIDVDDQRSVIEELERDLRALAQGIDNEFINKVQIEEDDDDDPDCQRAIVFSSRLPPNPDRLGIWKKGHIRVFISHRNEHRVLAHQLASALDDFGISCFVAHDTIPANEEWRRTIVNGLETMEVLLAFVTDDFAESVWTMQEIGYALGKGVPCVSLKLGTQDPPGFISEKQALRGNLDRPEHSAADLFNILSKAVGRHERLQEAIITAFVAAADFNEARDRFIITTKVVEKLSDAELAVVIEGYYRNDQLYRSAYLDSKYRRLVSFLEAATGKEFLIQGREIRRAGPQSTPGNL